MKGDDEPVSRFDYGALIRLQDRWRNDSSIPRWKKDGMISLVEKLRHKIADNHYEPDGVNLYYPEDCNNYDVFMTVSYALDAFVIPRSSGFIMRDFGTCHEDTDID